MRVSRVKTVPFPPLVGDALAISSSGADGAARLLLPSGKRTASVPSGWEGVAGCKQNLSSSANNVVRQRTNKQAVEKRLLTPCRTKVSGRESGLALPKGCHSHDLTHR